MYFFVVFSCIHSHQLFILKMFKPTEKLKNSVIYTHIPFMWIHQLTFVTLLSLSFICKYVFAIKLQTTYYVIPEHMYFLRIRIFVYIITALLSQLRKFSWFLLCIWQTFCLFRIISYIFLLFTCHLKMIFKLLSGVHYLTNFLLWL